ncbi:conserved hypothetical protein [uncultured Gammaproteobacteria bacterium]
MNRMLKRAIAEVVRRPEDEQETVAALILDELNDEQAWQTKFNRDSNRIAAMARRAREQRRNGETTPLVFPPSE